MPWKQRPLCHIGHGPSSTHFGHRPSVDFVLHRVYSLMGYGATGLTLSLKGFSQLTMIVIIAIASLLRIEEAK